MAIRVCARARHRARRKVLQALYQSLLSGSEVSAIERYFAEQQPEKKVDAAYFERLLRGILCDPSALDALFTPYLDRPLEQLDPIERSVLRMATYEFSACIDIPYRVVINEALELTKVFGAEDGYKYVNGVLDKLAKQLRPMEGRSPQVAE